MERKLYKRKLGLKSCFVLSLGFIISYLSDYSSIHAQEFAKPNTIESTSFMNLTFKNIQNPKIKNAFKTVLERYNQLHDYEILVVKKSIAGTTMQAQPVITPKSIINGVKRYRINISEHIRAEPKLKLADLDVDILIGWFAHELGHVMDYQQYSNIEMLWYGARYIFSSSFKRKVEYDADYIAIANGFHEEIAATKEFILMTESISPRYKQQIEKFYLPLDEVIVCSEDKELLEPYLNL